MAPKVQDFPRREGLFDESAVVGPCIQISSAEFDKAIKRAIKQADEKAMRSMLSIPDDTQSDRKSNVLAGKALFKLFGNYCNDPATAPAQFSGASPEDVARKLFDVQQIGLSRMNAGWRYQFLAVELAQLSKKRFRFVSGGSQEADLSAVVPLRTGADLHLYVSVKNRRSTISGSRWAAAITDLEKLAVADKNKTGPYLCVFGLAMEKGHQITLSGSSNTEMWKSDFFWTFFSGRSYKDIMLGVGRVLAAEGEELETEAAQDLPQATLDEFVRLCETRNLLHGKKLREAEHLVDFFL